jgi:hypothetical protein
MARSFLAISVIAAVALPALSSAGAKEAMAFAADMAGRGNWREARYRWEQILAEGAQDAKIFNNLAVAAEATGDTSLAAENYSRALELASGEPAILDNYRRFERLSEILANNPAAGSSATPESTQPDEAEEKPAPSPAPPPSPSPETLDEGAKLKGKSQRVDVSVPIPPRIDMQNIGTLLVASFLADESALLDVNDELARFLRAAFHRHSQVKVLDVVPPPAIPEQRIEDLIANAEFWKHLGREYGADLIVSGVAQFGRQEASGFEEVDVISPTTGQKVRETRFVEQEEFTYALDLLYMDGKTGSLLFRDRLRKAVRYRGLMNDPLHAFYELGESLSQDIVGAVSTRMRVESRTIFKR